MKFSKWIEIREQMNQPSMAPAGIGSPMKKPMMGKDKTLDNVKNILKKSKDPTSQDTIKQISQVYDNELDKSTDGAQMGSIASKKSSVLNNLLKK